MRLARKALCILFLLVIFTNCNDIQVAMIDWETSFTDGVPNPSEFLGVQLHTASRIAVDMINQKTYFPSILPNTTLVLNATSHHLSIARAVSEMINFAIQGNTLVLGTPVSSIAATTASVGTVYGVAQLCSVGSSSTLSNDRMYPYFTRMTAGTFPSVQLMVESLLFFSSNRRGWNNVALISTINEITTDLAQSFIKLSDENSINIATFQQFLVDETDFSVELREIRDSGARVIAAMIFSRWEVFIDAADTFGLVGDNYVWVAGGTVPATPFPPSNSSRGLIAPHNIYNTTSPAAQQFYKLWTTADPTEYPTAGPGTFPLSITFQAFDMIIAAATAMTTLDSLGLLHNPKEITPEQWTSTIRNVSFNSVMGHVAFDSIGDFKGTQDLYNYTPEKGWEKVAILGNDGLEFVKDIIWYSNTTNIPDLDIREPFDYWSCHSKEKGNDPTGKQVELHSPGHSDVDDIDFAYHCDHFIDCQNLSDENTDCTTNYTIVFIVFGVITGVLILVALLLIMFVIVFGMILKYRRLRHASPFFLILLLCSVIVGLSSVYAWFGKPHPVACAFQPWLLGLPTISMIVSLTVKIFRIWRIFRFPMKRIRISNLELCIYWTLIMVPAVLIVLLWTIISTPTAKLEYRNEKDHYVCTTGGYTAYPGGLVFFFIFVSYCALVLLVGAIISVFARKVPSKFNESTLLIVSIYNLGFLGVVIIPVFLVVNPYNPFVAWILRTSAILYAFTATMLLQFLPIVFGVLLVDKGKNKKVFKSHVKFSNNPNTTPTTQSSETVQHT